MFSVVLVVPLWFTFFLLNALLISGRNEIRKYLFDSCCSVNNERRPFDSVQVKG
jgi:hypothetical protein